MATCKDCLHDEVCQSHCDEQHNEGCCSCMFVLCVYSDKAEECPNFKDRSRIIELPCKLGDPVYIIRDCSCYNGQPDGTKIKCSNKVYLGKRLRKDHCGYVSAEKFGLKHIADFGKTCFLTREEAETALEKLSRKDDT